MQTFTLINTGSGLDATLINGKSCKVFGIDCMNNFNNVAYLYLYNTSSTPTTGLTPVRRYLIPSGGAGLVRLFGHTPLEFTSGLGFLLKGGIADADSSNITAGNVLINIDWG